MLLTPDVREALKTRTVRAFALLVLAVWGAALGVVDGATLAAAATWAGLALPGAIQAGGVTVAHAIIASLAWAWVVFDRAATVKGTVASEEARDAADRAARLTVAAMSAKPAVTATMTSTGDEA
jgi:hypothetical protein